MTRGSAATSTRALPQRAKKRALTVAPSVSRATIGLRPRSAEAWILHRRLLAAFQRGGTMTIDRRVILAFAMLAPALVGCGSVDSDPDEKTSKHADPLLERQSACSGTPTDLRGRLTGAQ